MKEIDSYPELYNLFCRFLSAGEVERTNEVTGEKYKLKIIKGLSNLMETFESKYKLFKK